MPPFQFTVPRRDRTAFVFLSSTFSTIWNSVPLLRLLNFPRSSRHSSQPHSFTSKAFVASGVVRPIPTPYFPQLFQSWRLMSLLQFGMTCLWSIGLVGIFGYQGIPLLELELVIRLLSLFLRKVGIINNPISLIIIYRMIKDYVATVTLRIISRLDRLFPIFSLWSLFWSIYSMASVRRKRFSLNYTEAWRQKYPNHAISVFFDRSNCVCVPCPDPNDPALDDAWLWNHLSFFYRISRIEGGIVLVLLPKSLVRLEIIQIREGSAAGAHASTLDVSPKTCTLIEDFTPVGTPAGQRSLVRELVQSDVYQGTGSTNPPKALKFVVGWDTSMISNIILLPTLLSIAVTVAWPIVAVLKYHGEVQASVQTGTAVGSFIITAGALVVGLVTLFDALAK